MGRVKESLANAYWGNSTPLPSGLPIARKLVNPSFAPIGAIENPSVTDVDALPKIQCDFVASHGSDARAGDEIVRQHGNDRPEQKKLDELVAKFSVGKSRTKK